MFKSYKTRLSSLLKRKGYWGAIKHIIIILYRNKYNNERFIFCVHSHNYQLNNVPTNNIIIKQYSKLQQVPPQVFMKASEIQIPEIIQHNWEKKLSGGATLWIAYNHSAEAVGLAWSVQKYHYNFPFFPLTNRDCVVFDVFVFKKFRNHGLGASMIKSIVHQLLKSGTERIYLDISLWNISSLKMIRKLNFELLGLAKYSKKRKKTTIKWMTDYNNIYNNLMNKH